MTQKNLFFPVASIYTEDGLLVIDASESSIFTRHYNVRINISEEGINVISEKAKYEICLFSNDIDVHLLTPSSVEEVRKNFWSKKKVKVAKRGLVEYKKRNKKIYNTKNYLIIEDHE